MKHGSTSLPSEFMYTQTTTLIINVFEGKKKEDQALLDVAKMSNALMWILTLMCYTCLIVLPVYVHFPVSLTRLFLVSFFFFFSTIGLLFDYCLLPQPLKTFSLISALFLILTTTLPRIFLYLCLVGKLKPLNSSLCYGVLICPLPFLLHRPWQ